MPPRKLAVSCLLAALCAMSAALLVPAAAQTHASHDKDSPMHASMMRQMKAMDAVKSTGDIDRDFAAMMRAHHEGAVDMAEILLKHGKDPTLRAMATKIIADQKKEIRQFDEWLAKRR